MEDREELLKQALRKYLRALKARDLLEVLSEYFEEEKKRIYEAWQKASLEEWWHLKAKLEVLEELEMAIKNDAENVGYYHEELQKLEKEEVQ